MSLFPCQPLIYVSISLHSHFLPHPSSMLYSIHLLLPQLYIFFYLNFLPQVNFVPRGTPFFHCEIKFLILRPWNLNDPSFLYIIPHFHSHFIQVHFRQNNFVKGFSNTQVGCQIMLSLEYVPNSYEGRFHELQMRFTNTTGRWY